MKGSFWAEQRTIVALAVSMLTLAEIVDLTIVSVALPDIMGALGANINEISLTMTSYIVVSAIFIPLTGIVSKKYGSKTLILWSAVIFGVASVLCGLSTTLFAMVFFRIIQGIGGAFLPAVSQAYIADNFTPKEQPKIMTVYSLCIIMGPVIGPIFGGAIVQHLNWSWIFYVNVPICLIGFVIIYFLMDETKKEDVKTDYLSFAFMAVGIGCLEYFLDEGNQYAWFESKEMLIIFCCGLLSITFFVWRGVLGKSVVDFSIFKSMNFNLSCFLVFMFMVVAVLTLAYYPTLLQQGYGYPVDLAGYITSPRGMVAFIAAPIFIQLSKKFDPRHIIFLGLFIYACSNLVLCTYGTNQNQGLILISMALQGVGLIGVFVVLVQVTFTGLAKNLTSDASGMFNFFRNIGNSVGTSVAATVISRQQQVSWNNMSGGISTQNVNFLAWTHHLPMIPLNLQLQIATIQIRVQSFLIANLDVFYMSLIGTVAILWIPFFLDKPNPDEIGTQIMH